MTVRLPLKLVGVDLREMTTAEVAADVTRAVYLYGGNPSVTLSVATSGGNLPTLYDNRLMAGASTTDITNFDTAAETPNVSTRTLSWQKVTETRNTAGNTTDTNSVRFPVYFNNSTNTIQAMSLTDFRDTFIKPAIDILTNANDGYGKYRIHTSSSLSSHTRIDTASGALQPVFADTRANASLFTAANIPESTDQSQTVQNYYLFRGNSNLSSSTAGTANVLFAESSGNLRAFSTANWEALLLTDTRYVAKSLSGSSIHYTIGTSTSGKRGSGMTDTRFNSSSYNQRFVNSNDYRTQEFPAGSAVSQSTNYLRILQY